MTDYTVTITDNDYDISVTEATYTVTISSAALSAFGIGDLNDVDNSALGDGKFLQYNGTTSKHEYVASSATVGDIDDIGNVTITTPTDDQVLAYDTATTEWINQTVSIGTAPTFISVGFDTTNTDSPDEGVINWNADDGTLQVGMPGGDVKLQIGQESIILATNNSGSAMSNGDVVYVSGGLGNKPTIALADADSIATSGVIGVLTEDIANNNSGYVTTFGLVRDIDTSSFSAGALLWLSQTAGNLTSTKPTQPAIGVVTAICITSHATEGIILVKTQNIDRLVGLSDVLISGQSDNDFIYWDNATSTWKAKALTASDTSDFDTEVANNTDVAANTTHRGTSNIHFTEASIDHTQIQNNGSNTHSQIDSHLSDGTKHYLEGSIDHTAITNIGTNTHAQVDTHLADSTKHYLEGSIDHANIVVGASNSDHDGRYYTETELDSTTPGSSGASKIGISELNTATYDDVQALANTTQSSGKISGGGFTDNTNGSITVAAGTGILRATNSDIAEMLFCDWVEDTTVSLVDEATNYIYIDYNSGTPIVGSTTVKTTVDNRTKILLGKVFREGTSLHFVEAGMIITEATKRTLTYLTSVFGEVTRASGYIVSETGTRNLATTDGVLFAGLTRLTTAAIDTSGTDTFELYYKDSGSGWNESSVSQIDNTYWDDGTGTLNDLTVNRYGVHWVYGDPDGHLMVVYGQGDYTLTLAEAAQPPSSLPSHITDFGFLTAKVIIQKSAASFTALGSAYDTSFSPSGVTDHGELAGLADDDHTQYILVDGTRDFTGSVSYATQPTFTGDEEIVTKKYVDDEVLGAGGYNDEAAQDAVGTIMTDSATINFTYNDATPSITGVTIDAAIDHDSLLNTHNLTTDIDHTAISNIGTNTHAQIDTHIASTTNPHSVDKTDVSLSNVDDVQQMPLSYLTTDTTLGSSDVLVPSQNAVKEYVDNSGGAGTVTSVAAGDGLDFTTITGAGSVTMGTPGTLDADTISAVTTTSHVHTITTGITDNSIVQIAHTSVADNDFAQFNASGVEGRNFAEVRADLDLEAGTDFYGLSAEDTWRNSVTQTEMGYLNGVSSDIQTQLNAKGDMDDVVDDTTPQLGGNLDWNSNGNMLVGQTVGGSAGDLVYLSSANTWTQADADAEATCSGMLGINMSATTVLTQGVYTTTGLTAASIYYASTTAGGITVTAPSATGDIVRIIGYALSTTEFFFDPDKTFIEV